MDIGGIGPGQIRGVPGIEAGRSDESASGADAGGFARLLSGLAGTSQQADGAMTDLAVGADRDLHDVVLAVEMESLAFDLAVQIRNRLVDAYHEIFRMQV